MMRAKSFLLRASMKRLLHRNIHKAETRLVRMSVTGKRGGQQCSGLFIDRSYSVSDCENIMDIQHFQD